MLSFAEYKTEVLSLPFGKKVGKNLYILWPDLRSESPLLSQLLGTIGTVNDTTLIKFFLDQYKVSFLQYPDFFLDPHPRLHLSQTLDLSTGKHRTIDYTKNSNPPILHRKETMISPNREEYDQWIQLTKLLEDYGCYEFPKKIGFRQFWESMLEEKGLVYEGHHLIKKKKQRKDSEKQSIDRHKTAMSRSDFSRPVQLLTGGITIGSL